MLPGIVAIAILFTWVFNHARGGLLLALLFHTAIAVTALFVAVAPHAALICLGLQWIVILLIFWRSCLGRATGLADGAFQPSAPRWLTRHARLLPLFYLTRY